MKLLMIGDIVGRPGRQIIHEYLHRLRRQYSVDMVIANGENAAGGFGITPDTAADLMDDGIDVFTSGNHIWAQKTIIPHLEDMPILRPLNYPPGVPGHGWLKTGNVLVVNLIGRTFMTNYDCPFRAMDALLDELEDRPSIVIIDFHAEATSEKVALGMYLDGRVSAVLGTHTHIGTIDSRILPAGTAYVTDIGMTGPADSVIGDEPEDVLRRFLTMMPHHLTVARGRTELNAIVVDIDETTGKAVSIERIQREMEAQ